MRNLEEQVVPPLKKSKAQIVAISVDRVEEGLKTKDKQTLSMTLVSDPKAKILKKYNLINKVPEEMVAKFKNDYQIDLEASSGEKHHTIAVPGVFVINQKGVITYSFIDENYKIRAPEEEIIEAVKKITLEK